VIETTLDGAALLRLNRSPVNALDIELNEAIASTFGGLDGPVVLMGRDRCFSAGVDLRAILDGGPDYTARFLESLVAAFLAVFDYSAPVVAAVNGHAVAGGCVIAMAADVRYMSRGTIGVTEIAVGVPFPVSPIEIRRHVMGTSATEAALGGEPVTAQEALRLGWIDATVELNELLDVAAARARELGALSPEGHTHSASGNYTDRRAPRSRTAPARTRLQSRIGAPTKLAPASALSSRASPTSANLSIRLSACRHWDMDAYSRSSFGRPERSTP
jgi:enoyl-CoA hydratase